MCVLPVVMRVSFPYQPPFSGTTVSDLFSVTSFSGCRRGKQRLLFAVCSIPARDVVIDFGKFKGCKMGTLPSRYLRWLSREAHQSSLAVWGDYAEQVLQDPYYKDRLEWQKIENLGVRGEMRKSGGPPAASAGVKGSMTALGWDLLDHKAWSKVNFSLLGTTGGGRIPRKELDQLLNVKPAIMKPKTVLPESAMEAKTSTLSASKFSPSSRLDRSFSNLKAVGTSPKPTSKRSSVGEPQPSRSLSLQEELLRRRQLRRERSAPKSLTTLPSTTDEDQSLFPGRDSLMKRARKRADT